MNLNEQIYALIGTEIDLTFGFDSSNQEWWAQLDYPQSPIDEVTAKTFEQLIAKAYQVKFGVWPS